VVNAMQAPGARTVADGRGGEAEFAELVKVENRVLRRCKRRDRGVQGRLADKRPACLRFSANLTHVFHNPPNRVTRVSRGVTNERKPAR
jgi:hypothetical protein